MELITGKYYKGERAYSKDMVHFYVFDTQGEGYSIRHWLTMAQSSDGARIGVAICYWPFATDYKFLKRESIVELTDTERNELIELLKKDPNQRRKYENMDSN